MCELNPIASDGVCYAPGTAPKEYASEDEANYCPLTDADSYAAAERPVQRAPQRVTGKAGIDGFTGSASGTMNAGKSSSAKAKTKEDDSTPGPLQIIAMGALLVVAGIFGS